MKRLLAAALLTALFAAPALAEDTAFDGLYVGGAAGPNWTTMRLTEPAMGPAQMSETFAGPRLDLFGGLGKTYGRVFVGGEIGLGLSAGDGSFSDGVRTMEVRQPVAFTMSARGGVLVTPSILAYGLAGLETQTYLSKANYTDGDHMTVHAFKIGLGGEYAVTESLFTRAQYTRAWAPSLGASNSDRAHTDAVTIGAGWRF